MIASHTNSDYSEVKHALATPTDLSADGVAAISGELRGLLDEHSEQIFAMTDDIAERARKIGGTSLRSIGDIARHQRLQDNDEEFVATQDMLAELASDNRSL